MIQRILRSLSVIAILAAAGCSTEPTSNLTSSNNQNIPNALASASVSTRLELGKLGQTDVELSEQRLDAAIRELRFRVRTSQSIDGCDDFGIALYGRDLGSGREAIGYRVLDQHGDLIQHAEFGIEEEAQSWVKLSRASRTESWSLELEARGGELRAKYDLNGATYSLTAPVLGYDSEQAVKGDQFMRSDELRSLYLKNGDLFDGKYDILVASVLTDSTAIDWLGGETPSGDGDGPQLINVKEWLKLACMTAEYIEGAVCDPNSPTYDSDVCQGVEILSLICKLANKIGVLNY